MVGGSITREGWMKSSYSLDNGTCLEWQKSSYSAGNGACLEWQRSTYCDSSSCVETAGHGGLVLVRDSKNPDNPHLTFSHDSWKAFIAAVAAGDFD
jgi:hypothetical protein